VENLSDLELELIEEIEKTLANNLIPLLVVKDVFFAVYQNITSPEEKLRVNVRTIVDDYDDSVYDAEDLISSSVRSVVFDFRTYRYDDSDCVAHGVSFKNAGLLSVKERSLNNTKKLGDLHFVQTKSQKPDK